MLSDEAKQGDSGHFQRQKHSRQTAKHQSSIDDCHQGIAREEVLAHVVSAGSHKAEHDEGCHHQPRSRHHLLATIPLHHPVPQSAEVEEVARDEDIAEAHGHVVARPVCPVTDGREEHREPAEILHFVDVPHHHVNREERKEEPDGGVAVEAALHPDVVPLQRFDKLLVPVHKRKIETEIDRSTNNAAHQVGHQQTLAPVLQIVEVCAARRPLVEVSGLEEEETHEEETPLHDLEPPFLMLHATEGHDVQRDHADDANATKDVEGVVSLFHNYSGKANSSGRWLTFISSGMSLRTVP